MSMRKLRWKTAVELVLCDRRLTQANVAVHNENCVAS